MNDGIFYIASGKKYYQQAVISARSAREVMPNVKTAIVTDQKKQSTDFNHVIFEPNMHNSFKDKPEYMTESPFNRTLFVDTDTFFCKVIIEMWELLNHYDIAATHSVYRRYDQPLPVPVPEYSSGVILFKNSDVVEDFLIDWKEYFGELNEAEAEAGIVDQPSFRYALFQHEVVEENVKFLTLARAYNVILDGNMGYLKGPAKILHGSYTQEEFDELSRKINHHTDTPMDDKRVYHPQRWPLNGIKIQAKSPDSDSRTSVLLHKLHKNGLLRTMKYISKKLKEKLPIR